MDRRAFLKSVAGAAGATALAPLAPLAIEPVTEIEMLSAGSGYSAPATITVNFPKFGMYPVTFSIDEWVWAPLKISK